MWLLIASIVCSVSVSVFLKLARSQAIHVEQAIAVNYLTAFALCWGLLRPNFAFLHEATTPIWLLGLLGVILPAGFIILAQAVQRAGIVLTDAAQRLSLFLPLLAAPVLFGESFTQTKLIGIGVAFLALLALLHKPTAAHAEPRSRAAWYLLLTWLCFGTVDILFKQLSKAGVQFAGSLSLIFLLAAALMLLWLWIQRVTWQKRSLASGLLLGLLNFGNIYFYIKAHQHFAHDPSVVFASMNLGVISLGALVGAGLFKEKVSHINILGVLAALGAIIILMPR